MHEVDEFQAYQFAARASRLDKFKFTIDIKKNDGRRAQQQEEEETKITWFYAFIHSLISGQKIRHCRLDLDVSGSQETRTLVDSDMCIFIKYSLKTQQKFDDVWIPSPDKSVSTIGHEIINCLDLNLLLTTVMTVPLSIIEFLSKNCPCMHKIHINNSSSEGFKVLQVDEKEDGGTSFDPPAADLVGINSNNLVKVWTKGYEMRQDTLDHYIVATKDSKFSLHQNNITLLCIIIKLNMILPASPL